MAARPLSLLLLFLLLLSLSHHTLAEEEEDLTFLTDVHDHATSPQQKDYENYDDLDDDDDTARVGYNDDDDDDVAVAVDEKDVVVLGDSNFTQFIGNHRHVMVEFYAPWCGHCQALAPEYAAAATELKEAAVLAKVDATEEREVAKEFGIEGYPTVLFFVDGVKREYPGQRNKDAIVTWIKKKTGPALHNLTTVEEAELVLAGELKVVLGFFDSLVGPHSEELASVSQLEDDVSFYQTSNPEVAKLFGIDSKAKCPSLVLLKKEAEKISIFDGEFITSSIAQFVYENKIPLVTNFTREIAPVIFDNPIKKQLLLFATANDTPKFIPAFQEASKAFKGKLLFIYVDMDNEDVGASVSEYFGVAGNAPRVLAYTGNEDARKFVLDGDLTSSSIKSFGEDFLEDKLKPFHKSDPIPETNDGDVKIVVGNNFDEIVLDESKDVLLEIYAPWCGHCQSLEPIYNTLAKHLSSIDSIVIAKMDGTTNEHPRAKPDGFPTILFFPAGIKSFDPITVDTDRTVVAFYKFLKKNASIPFKLQKPAATVKKFDPVERQKSDESDLRDEL